MEKKERKQLSPEALEKLALAREKALQVRLQNKLLRERSVSDHKQPEPPPTPKEPAPFGTQPEAAKVTKPEEQPVKTHRSKKRSKIIISNGSSSDSDDDTPVVYIRSKKKRVHRRPIEEEQEEVARDYRRPPTPPSPPTPDRRHPPITRQPAFTRPRWMDW